MQSKLFDPGEGWEDLWQGMPEFVQNDLEPYHTINVHFETPDDMKAFAKLVGQQILVTTKSIWHPALEISRVVNKRWISEEKE